MARLRNLKKQRPVSVVVIRVISRILAEMSHRSSCERGNRLTFIALERGSIRHEFMTQRVEENVEIPEKESPFKIKLDPYHNLIIESSDELNHAHNKNDPASPKTEALMKSLFFVQFVTERADCTKTLYLSGNDALLRRGRRLTDSDVPDLLIFLRDNPNIVELSLPYNEIHCDGFINIIDHITTYQRIVKLNVQNNEIKSEGITHLFEFGEKLNLQSLNLNGNKFGAEDAKKIALMLLKNRSLRELSVAEVDQTISSLLYFTTILRSDQDFYNDTLKILNISRPIPEYMNFFDSAHFSSLVGSMLGTNSSLQELCLRKCGFSCHDIELMFSEGRSNKSLLLLNLSENNVGDFGVALLANWLKVRPALRSLIISHNIVTSTGARDLSRAMPFSKIKHLDVSYNRIDDTGIRNILNTIKKSPSIRQLNIFGNCIGPKSAEIINRMLLSGVLIQDNLDVRPYKVNGEWHCARY